mmetsp:Transcript_12574/g.16268  ORF Transcript_12574/g.16268 Transcript_12574/m.16268 type:complete len:137 (+) Transcript_12574:326-736(+)
MSTCNHSGESIGTMNVAIFGSSFNPPHNGHIAAVRYFASKFDEVWVLPVYRHAYSSKSNLPTYEEREQLAKLAFDGIENVVVKPVEKDALLYYTETKKVPEDFTMGSIDVIQYLKTLHKDINFSWIIGKLSTKTPF